MLIQRGKEGEVYNIGANDEVTNVAVAERILEVLGKPKSLIEYVPDRLGHDLRYALDCRKIHDLGWKPAKRFDDALVETVGWYEEHPDWWKKIKEKSKEFKNFYEAYYKKQK
jgi:dTDP-glucose 4,6-dehydratase